VRDCVKNHLTTAMLVKRRAQSIINDKSIDGETRAIIRYGLEINDHGSATWSAPSMQAKPSSINLYVHSSEEKIETLTDLICRAGDEASALYLFYLRPSKTPPTQKPSQTPRHTSPSPAAAN
jgi:hypothetical protein